VITTLVLFRQRIKSSAKETVLGCIRSSVIQNEYVAGLETFRQKSLSSSKDVSEFCVL
jgi:hypothetical protein